MAEIKLLTQAGFSYYGPNNWRQAEFHSSSARHKLLVGGYGSGKTYPTIHDFLFHCLQNPGHEALACRNTWDTLEDELQDDILKICRQAGIIKKFISERGKNALILPNDCTIMFRPLTLKRANFKGLHICAFYIDDPDVERHWDTIGFLRSRLRNPPDAKATCFKSYITANWEGRNQLWKHYIRGRKEGGDGKDIITLRDGSEAESSIAYWICPTGDNPALPKTYISDQAAVHSAAWMDRYIYCTDLSSNIGLIYHSFDRKIHHMSREEILAKPELMKILAIDVGITHPTCILLMATDFINIYIYGEWFKIGQTTGQVAAQIHRLQRVDLFQRFVIDPSSAKRDQTSGTSVKKELRKKYGIQTVGADNSVVPGIQQVNDLLKPAIGPPRLYIDCERCPNLRNQKDTYRWKEPPNMDLDDMDYKEEPVKKDDDAVDAERYGVTFLSKFLKKPLKMRQEVNARFEKRREVLIKRSRFYDKHPKLREQHSIEETYKKLGFSQKKIKSLTSGRS